MEEGYTHLGSEPWRLPRQLFESERPSVAKPFLTDPRSRDREPKFVASTDRVHDVTGKNPVHATLSLEFRRQTQTLRHDRPYVRRFFA
ncbi:MAG TPA: hypothetical protein VKC66_27455 [Xanthobacteraceae bacterium]|nr:hypothetical protein [Xanthobacteraceae bacterium]